MNAYQRRSEYHSIFDNYLERSVDFFDKLKNDSRWSALFSMAKLFLEIDDCYLPPHRELLSFAEKAFKKLKLNIEDIASAKIHNPQDVFYLSNNRLLLIFV